MSEITLFATLGGIVGALIVLLVIGIPVGVSLGLVGFAGLCLCAGPEVALKSLGMLVYTTPMNFVLLAIPLFVLMAEILSYTGMLTKVFDALEKFFMGYREGLPVATIIIGSIMAALTGSSIASSATIGPFTLKEMVDRKVDRRLAIGSVSAAGGLAVIIPPSALFILYGFAADVSVAHLFIAGIIPGLLMALSYVFLIFIFSRTVFRGSQVMISKYPLRERIFGLLTISPLIMLAAALLASIYLGIATPSEAAALGVLASLIICIADRAFSLRKFHAAVMAAVKVAGFVFLIIVGAFLFGFLMSYLRIPILLMQLAAKSGLPPLSILMVVICLLLFFGCLLDGAALVLIIVPIVLPTLTSFGYNPVWLGMVLCITIEIGLITPPVGMELFVLQGIGKPLGYTYREVLTGALPFELGDASIIALCIIFPQLALWLPSTMTL